MSRIIWEYAPRVAEARKRPHRHAVPFRLMKGRDEAAYERAQSLFEIPILVLALAFLPIAVAPMVLPLSPEIEAALEAAAWLIWGMFVFEYVVLLYLAPDRRRMVRTHVLDLVIIVLPFLRPLRAARVLRLLRAGSAVGRAGQAVRRLTGRRGFRGFLAVVLGVIVSCGVLVWAFEHNAPEAQITSVADGLWWALVTATTVGYGDMVPVTAEGRGVAVLMMLVGIALLSVVTANIAAFFVEEEEQSELADVREQLVRLERILLAQQEEARERQ